MLLSVIVFRSLFSLHTLVFCDNRLALEARPHAAPRSAMAQKAHLLDSLPRKGIACLLIVFYVSLLICIIVGAVGPRATTLILDETPTFDCSDQTSCSAAFTTKLDNLATYNQLLFTSAQVHRPMTTSGAPALLDAAQSYSQTYQLDLVGTAADGSRTQLVNNVTHTAQIACAAGWDVCSPFMLFYYPTVQYKTYDLVVRWVDLLGPYAGISNLMRGNIAISMYTYTVPVAYTSFQLGWRYFFVTASALAFIAYSVMLRCGPGRTDAQGAPLKSSLEQKWVWALAGLLPLFNDPLFGYTIFYPSFGGSVFSALCTVSFLTLLLVYMLVHFHLAALQSEGGLNWQMDGRRDVSQLGAAFWGPKMVFGTAFWILTLSAYLWTRYQQISDPAYSLFEVLPAIGAYFFGFVYVVAAVYLLYLGALLLLACRNHRRMRASNKVFIWVTITTLVIIVVGVYLDVFTPLRTTSASYLVVYGAANLYVGLLLFAHLPDRRTSLADVIDEESGSGMHGSVSVDTTGVMGASGTEDLEVSVEDLRAGFSGGAGRKAGGGGAARKGGAAAAAPSGRRAANSTAETGRGSASAAAAAHSGAAAESLDALSPVGDVGEMEHEAEAAIAVADGRRGVFVVEEADDHEGDGSAGATGHTSGRGAATATTGDGDL